MSDPNVEEAEQLFARYLDWKAASGKRLAPASRASYHHNLVELAVERGSLLRVTPDDLRKFEEARPDHAANTRAARRSAYREFFGFAVAVRLRKDNPALGLPAPRRQKRPPTIRRWGGLPRRDALPREFWPVFDFLREVWAQHPGLTSDELRSITARGTVPQVVEIQRGPRRGQPVSLSPQARLALEQMGGSIPYAWRTIQRAFQETYKGAFEPKSLKHLPPPGFGVELHPVLEADMRDLLSSGRVEDAARRAFIAAEDAVRRLVRETTGRTSLRTRDVVNYAFSSDGPLASQVSSTRREGLRDFLSGALSLFRNELAHGDVTFPDEAYGLEVVLVADLVLRLLDPIESKLTHPTPSAVTRPRPVPVSTLRRLSPLELEDWVVRALGGAAAPWESQRLGIDGFTGSGDPIQVKHRARVPRAVVDSFETAIDRHGATRGYLVAFSFTRGAAEEARRASASGRLRVGLMTIGDVVRNLRNLDVETQTSIAIGSRTHVQTR